MAYKPRLDAPCGLCYVLARGNRRATIFHDDVDYRAYWERLERYRQQDGVMQHARELMPNRVHRLQKTSNRPSARTMQTHQVTVASTTSIGTARPGMSSMAARIMNWSQARLLI